MYTIRMYLIDYFIYSFLPILMLQKIPFYLKQALNGKNVEMGKGMDCREEKRGKVRKRKERNGRGIESVCLCDRYGERETNGLAFSFLVFSFDNMKCSFVVAALALVLGHQAAGVDATLPTPVKLLGHLNKLEHAAINSINRFHNTSSRLVKMVVSLEESGVVDKSNACWKYIASNLQSQLSAERGAVDSIQKRYAKLLPITRKGGKNLTRMFDDLAEAGRQCRARCDLEGFKANLTAETARIGKEHHALCSQRIGELETRLMKQEDKRQADLQHARSMLLAESTQAAAAAGIQMDLESGKVVKRPDVVGSQKLLRGTLEKNDNYGVVEHVINIKAETPAEAKAEKAEKTNGTKIDVKGMAKEYFVVAKKELERATKEEQQLLKALEQLAQVHDKMKQEYVDPEAAARIMVGDCHESLKKQREYFNSTDSSIELKHTQYVQMALKAKDAIKVTQGKLDVRDKCRKQILYMVGDETPGHVVQDMKIRHEMTSKQPRKIQHIPYF